MKENAFLKEQLKKISKEHKEIINSLNNTYSTPAFKRESRSGADLELDLDSTDEYVEAAEKIIQEWDDTSNKLSKITLSSDLKEKAEAENRKLFEIVKQVREDLENAAKSSPR